MSIKSALKNISWNIWHNHSRNMSDKKMSTAEKVAAMSPTELVKNTVRVSDWNKRILVFAGRYKNMAEIPDTLPFEVVDKARNRVRVKVCNIMIGLTVIGSLYMVIVGKRAAEEGETLTKINREWHKEYREKAMKEAEALKKA